MIGPTEDILRSIPNITPDFYTSRKRELTSSTSHSLHDNIYILTPNFLLFLTKDYFKETKEELKLIKKDRHRDLFN
jgi:hypothetical protein